MDAAKLIHQKRCRYFQQLLKWCKDHIIEFRPSGKGKPKCEVWLTEKGFNLALAIFEKNKRNLDTKGCIYGFELLSHPGHYKFGKAICWGTRRKRYCGHNTPGKVLFVQQVDDRHSAEVELLEHISMFMEKEIFGKEWFKTDMSVAEVEKCLNKYC